jgi:universal stress protein A
MKRVLAAIDGSEHSGSTVRLATELASGCGAELTVAYVSVPLAFSAELDPGVVASAHQRERLWVEGVFEHAVAIARQAGVEARAVVLDGGAAADTLADYANQKDFDLIVVGSGGKDSHSVRLGNVSDRLVHICKKPVLVSR